MIRLMMVLSLFAMVGCKKKEYLDDTVPKKESKEKASEPSLETQPPVVECPEEGGTIYFGARRGGVGLFRMNVDGTGVKNLRLGGSPEASPDGKKVAFVQFYTDTNRFEVAVMDVSDKGVTRLTKDKNRDSKNPAWSPDGTKIVFQTGPNNTPDIAVMNADGTGIKVITMDVAADYEPAWSPSGKSIVFTSDRDGTSGIYVIRPDGSKIKRLTPAGLRCSHPTWSPDGTYLAYVVAEKKDGWKRSIRVMDPKTGKWWTAVKEHDNLGSPAWSPKGGRLVYWATVNKKQDIYIADLMGKTTRKLTNGEGQHTSVTWGK